MEEIFGKDDEGAAEGGGGGGRARKKGRSVYDLEPDGDDFSGGKPTSTSTPAVGEGPAKARGRGGMGKREGLTMMGSNTYFYTGPRAKRGETEEGEEEGEGEQEEEDEDEEEEFVGGAAEEDEEDEDEEKEVPQTGRVAVFDACFRSASFPFDRRTPPWRRVPRRRRGLPTVR